MNQWSPVEVKAGDNIVYFDQGLMKMVEAVVIKKASLRGEHAFHYNLTSSIKETTIMTTTTQMNPIIKRMMDLTAKLSAHYGRKIFLDDNAIVFEDDPEQSTQATYSQLRKGVLMITPVEVPEPPFAFPFEGFGDAPSGIAGEVRIAAVNAINDAMIARFGIEGVLTDAQLMRLLPVLDDIVYETLVELEDRS